MDILTIIISIYAIIATVGAGIAVRLLLREKDLKLNIEQRNRIEREALIRANDRILTDRTDKFLLDIEKLTDKLLKTRGIAPIHEEREKKETRTNRFESTLNRRAREKGDIYSKNV